MKYKLIIFGLLSFVLAEIIHFCNNYTRPISITGTVLEKVQNSQGDYLILDHDNYVYAQQVTIEEYMASKTGDQYSYVAKMIDIKPNIQDDIVYYIGEKLFILLGAGLIIGWVVKEAQQKKRAEEEKFQNGIIAAINKPVKSSREKYETDLQEAIDNENYELAAKLRDKKK
jgi:hypothetical protein